MVSTPALTVCGPSFVLSIPPRSIVTTGTEVHLRWKIIPFARMEALMQHYKAAGFSEEVSRLAAAPRRMYDDQCLCYTPWATGQGFDPLSPTAAQIATFLYSIFDTHGLSPQTIKGYWTCWLQCLTVQAQDYL